MDFSDWRNKRRCFLLGLVGFVLTIAWLTSAASDTTSSTNRSTSAIHDQEQLRRYRDRFQNLTPEHQDRLREIHVAVSESADSERLQLVMLRYTRWLKSLTSAERYELSEMEPTERAEEIKRRLRREQAEQVAQLADEPGNTNRVAPEDLKSIMRWFRSIYWSNHREEILDLLPPHVAAQIRENSEGRWRQPTLFQPHIARHLNNRTLPPPTKQELAKLYNQLSDETVSRLRSDPDNRARGKLVREWVQTAMRESMPPAPLNNDELHAFFQELDEAEKNRLLQLSMDRMRRELMRLFHEQRRRTDRRGPGFPPNGERPRRFDGPSGRRPVQRPPPPPDR